MFVYSQIIFSTQTYLISISIVERRVEQELNMNVLFGKFHWCGIFCPKLVKFLLEFLKFRNTPSNLSEKSRYFVVNVPPIVEPTVEYSTFLLQLFLTCKQRAFHSTPSVWINCRNKTSYNSKLAWNRFMKS